MRQNSVPHRIFDLQAAERLALEAAVAQARADPRPAIAHKVVSAILLADAKRARDKIAALARR